MDFLKMKKFLSLCFYFLNLHIIAGFNLDTNIPIVKEGNKDSYFGFSVAQHIIKEERFDSDGVELEPNLRYVILVGAPRDNVTLSKADPIVRQTVRPGAIHQCPFSSSTSDCDQLDLMTSVPQMNSRGMPEVDRADQWLGVAVTSSGTPDGKALACAHRFKKMAYDNHQAVSAIWPFGLCVSMYNTLDEDNYYDVCGDRSTERGHKDYGMCQAGASATASKENDVLMGAPGVYQWRGMVAKNKFYMALGDDQVMYLSPHKEYRPPAQPIQPDTAPDSYLGMATAIGRLIKNQTTYVAGAPRSNETGQVFLYLQEENALEPEIVFSGSQFGSYFGNSLAVGDFNGDGLQDLVIGAPFFYDEGVGGMVSVYIGGEQGLMPDTEPSLIYSYKMSRDDCKKTDCTNARFGFSLATLDVDLDNYEDLVVGSPFEGDGVVYIYRGKESGIETTPSQRIKAADLRTARPLTAFGYSMSGGLDMDDNTYPDLVVGSYQSDKIMLLRSRPVVNITVAIRSTPEEIDPAEEERCAMTGRDSRCFTLHVCLQFTAKPLEKFDGPLRIDYRIEAETFDGLPRSRVFFKGGDDNDKHIIHRSPELYPQSENRCKSDPLVVYIQRGNRDLLNPIRFQLTYNLTSQPPPVMNDGGSIPDINEYPILNEQVTQVVHAVEFKKNCGDDKRCQSGLTLDATFQLKAEGEDTYILRQGQDLEPTLDITVTNDKEDAHETTLNLTLPKNLQYRGIDERGQKYSCLLENTRYVLCNLGNPLTNRERVQFSIRLNPENLSPSSQDLKVTLRVNTTSDEIDEADNFKAFNIKVVVQTDMLIIGSSVPKSAYFSGDIIGESAVRYEDQIGTEITHNYEVKNIGHGNVANSTVTIFWPYEVQSKDDQGKHLLYMIEEPVIDAPGKCFLEDWMVNVLKIQERPASVQLPNTTSDVSAASTRRKRDTAPQEIKEGNIFTLDCDSGTAKCFKFHCVIGQLNHGGDSVLISIRSRLWNSTFLEDYVHYSEIHVKSKAVLDIPDKLHVQQLNYDNDEAKAVTVVIPGIEVKPPEQIPLWIIIVAVLAGVILLCVIVILLYKCGFFQRKKAEDVQKHKAKVEKKKHTKSTKKNYNYYD